MLLFAHTLCSAVWCVCLQYCDSCLKRSYGHDLSDIIPSWQCPSCLGLCVCAACHRKSTKRGAAAATAPPPPGGALPTGSPSSIVSHAETTGHEEVPSGGAGEHGESSLPAPSPSSKRAVKSETSKVKAESVTPRQRKRAVAAHVQMAPEEEDQHQQQQQQHHGEAGGDYNQPDAFDEPPSHQQHRGQLPPPQLYLNGLHQNQQQHQQQQNQLFFSLASPNPLSLSSGFTPANNNVLLTPNGLNYNLSTYPSLDAAGNLDLESMTSGGSYRTGGGSGSVGGGSGSAMQTPLPGGAINHMMQFSPNPALYGQSGQAPPLMQYAASSSVDAQLQHVQQQIQIQQAILAQHQQAQGGYPFTAAAAAAAGASPSFTVPQPARGSSFVVDLDDEQSIAGGPGAATEFTGDGDESEYGGSVYQSNRNPTLHANGLTVEQMQALRLQQHQQQLQSLSPEQSNLMRQAGLDQRRALEEGGGGAVPGSMSVPSKTRSISGRSNAADRLSISPLTISRGMSGEDRPAGAERPLTAGGVDSNRNSPRFSSRSLSGRGNSSASAAVADPVVSAQDDSSSAGLSASQLADLEPLMSGMNMQQRQSFLAEAKALSHGTGNAIGNVPSPHSGSPRSAKRKIAAAVGGATTGTGVGPNTSGAPQAAGVDLSCPGQHVKYQMVARLKSQMHEAGGSGSANSSGSSPVLNNPADDDVIARTKLLQNEQKQMRLQHTIDEERRRLAAMSGQNKRGSPSQASRDLNISVKAEHAHHPQQQQQQQAHPIASPPNGLPPSHTPTSGTRRSQQGNKQLPSPLTHLASPPPPAASFNTHPGPLLFSPVPVFQSHGGSSSMSLSAGAQSPSTMLNLADSSSSSSGSAGSSLSGGSGSGSSGGMFSPPAPMFASSQHSMLPGQNSNAHGGQQPDYLQWGGGSSAAAAAGSHNSGALHMLSPMPGSLQLNYPSSVPFTPSLSNAGGNPASGLFSPNPMGYPAQHGSAHGGAQGGGLGLFSPDASYASSGLHYPGGTSTPSVPVLPASHDSGLGGELSYRQLSAGGQNLQMGGAGLEDTTDFMRQSSANLNMQTPAVSSS